VNDDVVIRVPRQDFVLLRRMLTEFRDHPARSGFERRRVIDWIKQLIAQDRHPLPPAGDTRRVDER
jgi:hypothetical protein